MAGYRLGQKKSGRWIAKFLAVLAVASLFWIRYNCCYHPIFNPEQETEQAEQSETHKQ